MRRNPPRPFAGQELTTDTMRPLRDAAVQGSRIVAAPPLQVSERPGGTVVISMMRGVNPALLQWMQVTAVGNDTLTCKKYNGSAVFGDSITVAKPPELRHDASWYADATGIATVDAQTVTASAAGEDDEAWKVTPDYIANTTEIIAYCPPAGTGISNVVWIDLNIGGRAWAVSS